MIAFARECTRVWPRRDGKKPPPAKRVDATAVGARFVAQGQRVFVTHRKRRGGAVGDDAAQAGGVVGRQRCAVDGASRDAHQSTATALLADIGAAFEQARTHFARELDAMSDSMRTHQARIANTLRVAELQLLWDADDKIAYEATVRTVWVLSPDLQLDTQNSKLQRVVKDNLARGVRYRYLVPHDATAMKRARALLRTVPSQGDIQVRVLPPAAVVMLTEVTLYDATTPQRLGLMIAPTQRPDVDCVLSAAHTNNFVHAYRLAWKGARALETEKSTH